MTRDIETYKELALNLQGFLSGEDDLVANLANMAALIKERTSYFWVGFYLVKNEQLVLGPFQGPVACTRIDKGKGVCGAAWLENRTIIVPDVHQFSGHIACSATSQSEVVIPIRNQGKVTMVLDIDSHLLDDFSQIDVEGLEALVAIMEAHIYPA